MTVTVNLTEGEVELLDLLARCLGEEDRSVAVRQAIGVLRMELNQNGLSRITMGDGFLSTDAGTSWREWFDRQG